MKFDFKIEPDKLSPKHKFYYLLWEITCAFFLVLWYAYFVYVITESFLITHDFSSLLYLVYELMIILFLVVRRLPKEISFAPYDWFVALVGTLGSTLLRPTEQSLLPDMDFMIGFQILGIVISLIGLLSLSKSYGTVAANRGVKTNGLYRYIRHPLYSGYVFSLTAFVLQNTSIYNIAVVAGVFTFKLLRIFAEEKLLLRDPEYQAYAKKTRWRVIPYIW